MFCLESSIAHWREQMLAAGIHMPVPLDELESHLREEIEQRRQSGMDEQSAFESAVRQIGGPNPLKSEFKKIDETKELREWKKIQIMFFGGLGSLILFVTTCLVFKLGSFSETTPAEQRSRLVADALLILLAAGGYWGHKIFPIIPDKRRRTVITISSAVLMTWWTVFFFVILPRADFTTGQLDAAIVWGFMMPFGALAGFVTGLEKAAHKNFAAASS